MVRAPCCEKMGLKRGPWTREEDQILINYINQYGHGNWRALPKQAGLLRCGKSCRLRWTNYLRPDIKRGNFSKEEEDTIIELHQVLGNRWSAIAARLPGRTDNEIKNVWHTHLKKRLKQNLLTPAGTKRKSVEISKFYQDKDQEPKPLNFTTQESSDRPLNEPNSPLHSSSDISSVTSSDNNNVRMNIETLDNYPQVDDNFWSEVFSAENSGARGDFPALNGEVQLQFPFSPLDAIENVNGYNSNMHDGMDFWHNLFIGGGELPELLEF